MGEYREKVRRHTLGVVINHWLIALSGLVLVLSGIGEMPVYKRYNIVKIAGFGWSEDFWLNLDIHYIAAAVFMAAGFFHLVYHMRRRELSIMPRKGDVSESVHIVKAMLTGGKEPVHEKFLAEQRLAYAAIAGAGAVLTLTGLVKAFKNLGPITIEPKLLQVITLTHTAFTMIFLLLIISHLAAFAIKANRPLLESMFTGKVCAKYAQDRHGRWKCEE